MALSKDPNQTFIDSRNGVWLWRKGVVTSIDSGTADVMFELPHGAYVLDGFVDVTGAGTASTSFGGTLNLENSGGDVVLVDNGSSAAINLAATALTRMRGVSANPQTTKVVAASGASTANVVLDITETGATVGATVTVGLLVVDPDLDPQTA